MEGKEAIVGRILSDAQQKAETRKAEAAARAENACDEARRKAEALLTSGRAQLMRDAEETVSRRETVAGLDVRKRLLAAKREAIEAVFTRALEKTRAFGKGRYLAVLDALLEAYAEDGDAVQLSKYAPVDGRELAASKVFLAKKLVFRDADGDFEGGLRLYNAVSERDLSFRAILEARRFELEREIVQALFPSEK